MTGPYDDIINLPHPTSAKHPRMPLSDRAAQFAPFAALSGHSAALVETARLTDQRMELDEDARAALDSKQQLLLERIKERPEITVTWFQPDAKKDGGRYIVSTGRLKRIHEADQVLILVDGLRIPIEEGRFRGGSAPYGYRLEKSGILNKRKHEVYMLVIDEDEARVVRMMFDLCISSGYGRWRLANFLNDHGIKNRKGQNWHDASVGGILHNPLYKGILRSGETYAGPFEALQIIAPDQFDLAQKLMLERTNERKERRTVPLNTTGQSLLSGNIFCGHCGGRLVLTTNGTTTRLADGTPVHKKRIRYVCYNKTRRRQECTGQTGYTMHILDGIVTEVLHQVFDKMQGASNDMIVGSAVQKQMAMIRSELQRARAENTKANKEYESLKAEVLKAIQGKSALPQDVLTEMLEDTRQKVLSTSERITTLTAELNDGNSKIEEMKAEFNRIVSWSKIFDESPMEVKKMICGYIIKKVSVFRDYRIKIEFNINVEQFLNGIDSIDECDTYELPMAQ